MKKAEDKNLIDRMKDDFEQERKSFIQIIKNKDEQIEQLKLELKKLDIKRIKCPKCGHSMLKRTGRCPYCGTMIADR